MVNNQTGVFAVLCAGQDGPWDRTVSPHLSLRLGFPKHQRMDRCRICWSRRVPCFGVSWKNSLSHVNLAFRGHVWGSFGSY